MSPRAPERFDPEAWASVCESDDPYGAVFRRTLDCAREAALARAEPGERWLDVGCGPGHLAAALAACGLEALGLDRDPAMVEAARVRFGSRPRLRFEPGDAEALPVPDRSVDGVVATSLLGLLDDLGGFFGEVRRVLRPGGSAVLTATNRASLIHRLRGPGGPRRYAARELRAELAAVGLEVAELGRYNVFAVVAGRVVPPIRLAAALERSPLAVPLARNVLVVAVNPEGAAARSPDPGPGARPA